ncbi:hypothetical protein [Sphingopyxis sp.]|uniref:hypothetical protein n=1 Tax=Sphingopyxis sp. TaxID=1908224 RepID=UPI003D80B01A
MTAAETGLFERQLAGRASLLEFGCGGSTVVAARRVPTIVSVDSNSEWLTKVGTDPAVAARAFTPFYADIGPVGEWGHPIDDTRIRDWPRYHAAVWRHIKGSPDVVLLDGRFRVACALQALIHAKPDTVLLFHDFADRPQYHVVLRHMEVVERADTLAVLRPRADLDGKAVLHDLFDHFLIAD